MIVILRMMVKKIVEEYIVDADKKKMNARVNYDDHVTLEKG